jgi:hypothetical protein
MRLTRLLLPDSMLDGKQKLIRSGSKIKHLEEAFIQYFRRDLNTDDSGAFTKEKIFEMLKAAKIVEEGKIGKIKLHLLLHANVHGFDSLDPHKFVKHEDSDGNVKYRMEYMGNGHF